MSSSPPSGSPPVLFDAQFDRRMRITVAILALATIVGGALTLHAAWPSRIRKGYQPEQPIAFSHRLHAGVLEVQCRYCHFRVDRTPHAGVPPLSVCMNCHGAFEPGAEKPGQVEKIGVLLKHWEEKKPVAWNKVHDLADFAYFDHSRHMVEGLDCRNCHGPIELMDVVKSRAPLTMGWCLGCHTGEREAIMSPDALLKGNRRLPTRDDPIYGKIVAPIHCSTCHR